MTNKRNQPSNAKRREHTTLDWDALRRRNAERLDEEISRGVDNPETRRRLQEREQLALAQHPRSYLTAQEADRFYGRVKPLSTPPVKKAAKPKKRAPSGQGPKTQGTPGFRVDASMAADIINMYQEGARPDDIAAALGITNNTVIARLKRAGVYDPKRFRPSGPESTAAAIQARWATKTTQPKGEYL